MGPENSDIFMRTCIIYIYTPPGSKKCNHSPPSIGSLVVNLELLPFLSRAQNGGVDSPTVDELQEERRALEQASGRRRRRW